MMSHFANDGETKVTLSFGDPPHPLMLTFIGIIAGIGALQMIVPPFNAFAMDWLAINSRDVVSKGRIWQMVTAVFLHGGLRHLMFNLLFLYIFGNPLAHAWRRKEFVGYFFLCGIAGSVCFYFATMSNPQNVVGLGASAAVTGIMGGYALVHGERLIFFMGMIPMKGKYFVALMFIVDIVLVLQFGATYLAGIAHLAGGVFGILLLKFIWLRDRGGGSGGNAAATPTSRIGGLELMDDD
jgi:membrane associated rhomboid family serine protease